MSANCRDMNSRYLAFETETSRSGWSLSDCADSPECDSAGCKPFAPDVPEYAPSNSSCDVLDLPLYVPVPVPTCDFEF